MYSRTTILKWKEKGSRVAGEVTTSGCVEGCQPLQLFPCNGYAIEALNCLGENWHCVGFVDDSEEKQGTRVNGIEVLDRSAFARWPDANMLVVPGGPESFIKRKVVIQGLGIPERRYAKIVHPKASVSQQVQMGLNTLVMAGVVLTNYAIVRSHGCIVPSTVIHHDSQVADWTLISTNVTIAGGTCIGRNC